MRRRQGARLNADLPYPALQRETELRRECPLRSTLEQTGMLKEAQGWQVSRPHNSHRLVQEQSSKRELQLENSRVLLHRRLQLVSEPPRRARPVEAYQTAGPSLDRP